MIKYNLDALTFLFCYDTIKLYDQKYCSNVFPVYQPAANFRSIEPGYRPGEEYNMNIAVAQSGGPTCAINASLVGVFKESLKEPAIDAIFGSVNGIEGMIENHLIDLKTLIFTNEDMELLRQTPSTVLGSCRYKLPDWHEDESV